MTGIGRRGLANNKLCQRALGLVANEPMLMAERYQASRIIVPAIVNQKPDLWVNGNRFVELHRVVVRFYRSSNKSLG